MPQLFPSYANHLARATIACAALGLVATGWAVHAGFFSQYATGVQEGRRQPVPFSHEHHVGGLGIDCRYCHTSVEQSGFAGMPTTRICLTCHSQLYKDAPMLVQSAGSRARRSMAAATAAWSRRRGPQHGIPLPLHYT